MAETLQDQFLVADVYATALFGLARQAGQVEQVHEELNELVKLCDQDGQFATFLETRAIDEDRRAASLEKLFRGQLSDLTLNTLLVMNEHGRAGLVRALQRRFVLALEADAGQIEVEVVSAVELTEAERQDAQSTAAKLSGRDPVMSYRVDPGILGGLILKMGDLRLDHSVRRQLHDARQRLADRGERGLATAVAE